MTWKGFFYVRLIRLNRYIAAGAHFAAIELLYVRRDLAKMENQIPELIVVLEKIATDVGATTPIVTDGKKGNFLSNKFASISIGSKSKDAVDYTADNRAAYLMLKGAMLKSLNRVCSIVQSFCYVSNVISRVAKLQPVSRRFIRQKTYSRRNTTFRTPYMSQQRVFTTTITLRKHRYHFFCFASTVANVLIIGVH